MKNDIFIITIILIKVSKKYNKMGKKEIIFQRKIKIQTLNRVALSPELLENMGLQIGDDVSVFFNIDKKEIIVKKEK
ncbi:hypothetical protein KAR52_01880 [Candidatus Pacearchaeota archaeon]|nr:hypothetical protein [Candidatus Pacearchaeota archaeon]